MVHHVCTYVWVCVCVLRILLWLFNQKKLGRRKILFGLYSPRQSTIEGIQGRDLEGGTMASFLINPRTVWGWYCPWWAGSSYSN